ncbi:MAG: hypothetical protein IKI69_00830 [Oscillospiraceae bacterium]|nr:hypothetical protein [Oscillospiraceae bacterium]
MMALFRRNTLCIARKSDEIRALIIREMPKAYDSAFTLPVFPFCTPVFCPSTPATDAAGVGIRILIVLLLLHLLEKERIAASERVLARKAGLEALSVYETGRVAKYKF